MYKNIFFTVCFILLSVIILTGCPSTGGNIFVDETVGSEEFAEIAEMEKLILEYLASGEKDFLLQAKNMVNRLLEKKSFNKEYEARITGLSGEIAYYSGDKGRTKKSVNEIELKSRKEQQLFILKALLAKDPADKIAVLEEGLDIAMETGKITLYLAEIYFLEGEYGKATGFYDEAFVLLGDDCQNLFQKDRDLAFQFIQNPPDNARATDYIQSEIISVSDVLNILLLQSTYLDTVVLDKEKGLEDILVLMKEENFFHPDYLRLKDPLVRKDTAFLILAIITRLENDPDLMTAYQARFMEADMDSPVPDIKVDEYYFDPVLVLVEREIMELEDGINFFPNKPMSGLELNGILKRMKEYYGY